MFKTKQILIALAVIGANVLYHMPLHYAEAFNLNLAAQTAATGKTYKTNGIGTTTVSQETYNGDIILGQTINFGNYKQSIATGSLTQRSTGGNHDATYQENGTVTYNTENVNWIVVKDNGSGKYTLVSTKVLDQHIFDSTSQKWSESSMRTWMNGEMMNTMLTTREQALLQSQNTVTYSPTESGTTGYSGWDDSTNTNPDKGYNTATGDKLWLLSVQELHEYFKNDVDTNPESGTGKAYPAGDDASGKVPWGAGVTDYAKSKRILVETDGGVTAVDGSNNAYYFLRSPSSNLSSRIRYSYSYGAVYNYAVTYERTGVRPAMQVDLSKLLFTSVGGKRNSDGAVEIVGKYAGSGTWSGEYGSGNHQFTKAGCSQAAKFEEMKPNSNLDLTFYDVNVSQSGLTANTSLELGADSLFKLGYTGANSTFDIAGMIATGNATDGYTPVGWGKMALAGSTTGTMGIGFNNIAPGDYSLHIMGEEGTGTSFVGDVAISYDGFKKTASGLELDLTTTGNTAKTFSGAITVAKNNKLTANVTQLTGNAGITNGGDIILKGGGTLNHTVAKNGTDVGTLTVNDGAILFAPTSDDSLDNYVTIKNGATLTANANVFNQTVTAEAGGTAILKDGTLDAQITGTGNLDFAGNVSTNADNIATAGTNTVESGKTLTFTGGILTKNITGDGTAEFNNTVSVADGVNLGTATNNVNGTLDVAGNITASNINFKSGSTLKVDGSKITSTPAISGLTSASVESGSKLYIANAEKDTEYKILAGNGISVSGWQTDDDMADEFKASYGLKVDTENITNNGTEFNIKFTEDTQATGSSDIGNIVANLPADGKVKEWVDNISADQSDTTTQGNTVNTMANMAQLANVQTGTSAINNLTNENICINTGVMVRPMVRVGTSATLRNTSAKKSSYEIATIPLASKENMELHQENSKQVYSKEIWASYIHSKQKVDGMETGHLQQNSNIQYNGVTVGTDLWSGRHGFGGVALTYADGNVNSTQKVSSVKNETDYYGLTVYNRQDVGKFSFQYDGGITHSKNDVTMSTQGAEDVTARPKVNIYNIGGRVENSYKLSEKTEVVPFAGLRYTFVKTKEYHNSLGMGFDVDDQHMWNVPVGVAFRSNFGDVDGWLMGSTLEAGYAWNLGDRDSEQRITYGNTYDVVGFNTADKGQYFIKGALQAKRKNLSGEVGYRYSKGDTVRDSRWNFNVGVSF